MATVKNPVLLIVNDGWGIAPPDDGNYIYQANTHFFDQALQDYPHTENQAAGEAVGLPAGSQGNSEVGHLHLGAGRVVWQMFELINRSLTDKSFSQQPVLLAAMNQAKSSRLHLLGMISDGGIHSHLNHLLALLELAEQQGISQVYIHAIADGRDVPEKSISGYLNQVQAKCDHLGLGQIVSLSGRYYAMDRDNNWDRTQPAYDLLTQGNGHKANSYSQAIDQAYQRGDKTDYYIQPTVIQPFTPIQNNDVVIFFNFRTDRPRQLTKAFTFTDFDGFQRQVFPQTHFVTMTQYDNSFVNPFVFSPTEVSHNFASIIADHNLKQLRLAETDKYGHVTFFFNSQIDDPYPGEDRILKPSPKAPSYDQTPQMAAEAIRDEAINQLQSQQYDFILINFANCDLVGHTAVKDAIITAVETVDQCNQAVVTTALQNGYTVFLTADHGNAEDKIYPDGQPRASHTLNPVNFILISPDPALQSIKLRPGSQQDVAPTMLEILQLPKPPEMTGQSQIIRE